MVAKETTMADKGVIANYSQLFKIKENFRILKTDLLARVVFVWTENHIQAHFLTCFIASVIIGLLQHRDDNEHRPKPIISSLNSSKCRQLKDEQYVLEQIDLITKRPQFQNLAKNMPL